MGNETGVHNVVRRLLYRKPKTSVDSASKELENLHLIDSLMLNGYTLVPRKSYLTLNLFFRIAT
jgi:hypothetical protein